MKYFWISFIALTSVFGKAQEAGINFIDNDFDLALKKADAEGKMIFLYTYTTWCGPCKMMKKEVFPHADVGNYYNSAFVNVKMDMEKGQGFDIGDQYDVQAYPTFLYLDSSGKMIHKSMGGRDVIELLELGYAAKDPSRQITTLRDRYDNGDRSPTLLKSYAIAISEAEFQGFEPISQAYLDTQDDWTTPENIKFLFDYSEANYNSKLFQYTLEHRQKFIDLLGEEKVNAKIEFAAEQDRTASGIARDDVEALKIHYGIYFPKDQADRLAMKTYFENLMYSPVPREREQFMAEIQLYLASQPAHKWNFYNAAAWQLYEYTDDRDLLSKARDWSKISISKNANMHNHDTLAHILAKLGDKEGARKHAMISIDLAKQTGGDYTDTQNLLNSL